jgi:hypothetical protein
MYTILAIISAIMMWQMINTGFRLARRIAVATEAAALSAGSLYAALTPEARERAEKYMAELRALPPPPKPRKDRVGMLAFIMLSVVIILLAFAAVSVHAQGIYMGRDGRAHAQVIVGEDGRGWPVAPTFCTPGFGPCPVVLGPPLPWAPPPLAYAPAAPQPSLGWVYGPYLVCGHDAPCVVNVDAAGLNVRTVPNGPVFTSLANGVPVVPQGQADKWVLVTPMCPLAPTYAWSVTAGVPLMTCL